MSNNKEEWYYCLRHRRVEPWNGCRNSDRLGPYPTEQEAEHALEKVSRRNDKWDEEDDLWDDGT